MLAVEGRRPRPWARAFCGHTKRSIDWCRRTRRCARSSRRCGGSAKMRRTGGATRAVCRCPAALARARACAHAHVQTHKCTPSKTVSVRFGGRSSTRKGRTAHTCTFTGQTLRTRHGHGGSGANAPGQHGTRAQATRRRLFRLDCCPGLGSSFGSASGEV